MLMPEPVFLAGDWEYAPWLGLDDGPRPVLEPSGAGGSLCEGWLGARWGGLCGEGGQQSPPKPRDQRAENGWVLKRKYWKEESGGCACRSSRYLLFHLFSLEDMVYLAKPASRGPGMALVWPSSFPLPPNQSPGPLDPSLGLTLFPSSVKSAVPYFFGTGTSFMEDSVSKD